jgi:hypothetical protein
VNNSRVDRVIAVIRQKQAGLLMPSTPIEIEGIGEYIHLACEGQWVFRVGEKMLYHKKDTATAKKNSVDTEAMYKYLLTQTRRYLKDILRSNAKSWSGEYPLINPGWAGWADIDREKLREMAEKAKTYDATLL